MTACPKCRTGLLRFGNERLRVRVPSAGATRLFAPAPVEMASGLDLPRPSEKGEPNTPRRIEIELSDGCRIKIDEGVGLASLRRVLAALRG